jgi:hypothetical protein
LAVGVGFAPAFADPAGTEPALARRAAGRVALAVGRDGADVERFMLRFYPIRDAKSALFAGDPTSLG